MSLLSSLFGGGDTKQSETTNYTDQSANTAGDNSPAASGGSVLSVSGPAIGAGAQYTDDSVTNVTLAGGYGGSPAIGAQSLAPETSLGLGGAAPSTPLGSPGNNTTLLLIIGAAAVALILLTRK